jgi:hypothetical protein
MGFDRDGLRSGQAEPEARNQQAVQRAYELLTDYVSTATELNVRPRFVEKGHLALTAAGIALASWPKAADGSITYFPLVISSHFAHFWLAAESQGLSVTPANDFFLRGKALPANEAAAWLAAVAGYDEKVILETLENALKGDLSAV